MRGWGRRLVATSQVLFLEGDGSGRSRVAAGLFERIAQVRGQFTGGLGGLRQHNCKPQKTVLSTQSFPSLTYLLSPSDHPGRVKV